MGEGTPGGVTQFSKFLFSHTRNYTPAFLAQSVEAPGLGPGGSGFDSPEMHPALGTTGPCVQRIRKTGNRTSRHHPPPGGVSACVPLEGVGE